MRRAFLLVGVVLLTSIMVAPVAPAAESIGIATAVASGSLDPKFGADGRVILDVDGQARALAIEGGRILQTGYVWVDGQQKFAIARFTKTGDLDSGFGSNGLITTDFGGDYSEAAAVVSDAGRIVVAGSVGGSVGDNLALARYKANGTPDTTFSSDGELTFPWAYQHVTTVAVQKDRKIVVGGHIYNPQSDQGNLQGDFHLMRFNADGTLDTTFGSNGEVITDFGAGTDQSYSLLIQTDGKILLGGYAHVGPSDIRNALARYLPDGSLDPSFGTGGKVVAVPGRVCGGILDLALDSAGRIVAVGFWECETCPYDFVVARFNTDGSLDSTFGADGIVAIDVGGRNDAAYSVVVQNDGKIIVGGFAVVDAGGGTNSSDFGVARLNADGTLDSTFGSAGKVLTDFYGGFDTATSGLGILPGGRIVVSGNTEGFTWALATYVP